MGRIRKRIRWLLRNNPHLTFRQQIKNLFFGLWSSKLSSLFHFFKAGNQTLGQAAHHRGLNSCPSLGVRAERNWGQSQSNIIAMRRANVIRKLAKKGKFRKQPSLLCYIQKKTHLQIVLRVQVSQLTPAFLYSPCFMFYMMKHDWGEGLMCKGEQPEGSWITKQRA